jgi:hypothetical protein
MEMFASPTCTDFASTTQYQVAKRNAVSVRYGCKRLYTKGLNYVHTFQRYEVGL